MYTHGRVLYYNNYISVALVSNVRYKCIREIKRIKQIGPLDFCGRGYLHHLLFYFHVFFPYGNVFCICFTDGAVQEHLRKSSVML